MSKGSWLCSVLLLLQVCVALLPLISGSGSHLTGVRIGRLPCRDPIRRARLMSRRHWHDEFDGHSADSIFDDDEGADTGDEYASIDDGAGDEEEEGLPSLPPDGGGGGGGAKDSSGSGSGGGGDVQCPECGKFFKNDKSMFGHLRSHPNRGYKGATPPINKLKLSPDTAAAVASSSSSSPPGTDRPPARSSGRDPRLTPLEILCAYAILALRYRGNTQVAQVPPPLPPPSFEKLDATGAHHEGGARGSVAGDAAGELNCNAGAGVEAGNHQLGNVHEHGDDSFARIPKKRRNAPKEAVREAHSRKKAKLVPSPRERLPYVCKHCKAAFATNQALGGHVAGHHREKKVPRLSGSSGVPAGSLNGKLKVEDDEDDDKDLLPLGRGLLSEEFAMAPDVPWQSGQHAAGRQVRQHSERKNDDGLPPAAVAAATPADGGGGSRLWNIDLNVEAPEQE